MLTICSIIFTFPQSISGSTEPTEAPGNTAALCGAAPTPYYRIGESLLKHDYDKALKNPIHDKTVPIRDTYRREQAYKSAKHSEIKFQVNDVVTHPKFGEGTVEEIVQLSNSVRLHIRFADDEVKKIDQKWLLRSGHK